MKKVYSLLLILAMVGFSGCFGFRSYVVESDYSYYGQFKKYKSFDFFTEMNADAVSNAEDTLIRELIQQRLELQGYKRTQRNPNLMIAYKVFYDDFNFKGYNQPKIEQWVRSAEEDEAYDPVKYRLQEGTLLILLYDNKRDKAIWQGYASGLFGDEFALTSKRHIRRAVRSIFDQYQFLADGFVVEEQPR
ncbi:MAG: DUF4136 domain-containing protein [Catalinimonas sp.]